MTVRAAVPVLPAASRALMVIMLVPLCSGMPVTAQEDPPVATPEPPTLFDHETRLILLLLVAVPETVTVLVVVENVAADVGEVMVTDGVVPDGEAAGAPPLTEVDRSAAICEGEIA